MSVAIIDTLSRGTSNAGTFPVAKQEDLRIPYISVVDLATRDAIPTWQRIAFMTCYVVSTNLEYTLGSDITISGQIWTQKNYGVPANVVTTPMVFDSNGFIKAGLIQNIFLNQQYVVASQAAMLALTTFTGNFIIRTDTSQVFIKLNNTNPAALSDFAIATSPGAVLSVNGQTGVVSVTIANLLAVTQNTTDFNTAVGNAPAVTNNASAISALQSSLITTNTNVSNLSTYSSTHIGVVNLASVAQNPTLSEHLKVLTWNNTTLQYELRTVPVGPSGPTTFLGLSDVPSTYTGNTLKVVRVNAAETALEFATISPALVNGSGLTFSTNHYDLGGTLTGNVDINTGANTFNINANSNSGLITIQDGFATGLVVNKLAGGSYISLNGSNLSGSEAVYLYIDLMNASSQGAGAFIIDTRAVTKGLEYTADFSSGFTLRSLVDKGYVLGAKTYTGVQTFPSFDLAIRNPANTFSYSFQSFAITANRTIFLPILTSDDTMVTAAFAQTLTNKSISGATNTFVNIPLISAVTGILPGANGGTGVANTSKTITLGGNLTTSGAFATTLTATATTSVTLPVSGTLLSTTNFANGSGTTWNATTKAVDLGGNVVSDIIIIDPSNSKTFAITDNLDYFANFDSTARTSWSGGALGFISLFFSPTVATFNDSRATPKGLEYSGNYSAGYTTRSLVDQGYVLGTKTYTGAQTFKVGAAGAGLAPIYIPSGTNLTTTEAGALENNGTHLYFTFANSGTRFQLDQQSGISALTTGTMPYATSGTTIGDSEITRTTAGAYNINSNTNSTVVALNLFNASTGATAATQMVIIAGAGTSSGFTQYSAAHATFPSTLVIQPALDVRFWMSGARKFGISTLGTAPIRPFHIEFDDAAINAVSYVQRITKTTSGTATVGLGVGIEFEVENASAINKVGGTFELVSTNITNTTEAFDWVLKNMNAGAVATETFRIESTGAVSMVAKKAATPATTGTMTTTLTNLSAITITPTGACTFNASGGISGQRCAFVITTSGASSFVLTWGTNYKTTGTLATGTVTAKVFTVEFLYDGTNWNEVARTVAM